MKRLLAAAMLCLVLTGCKSEQGSDAGTANVIDSRFIADPNSYAQPDKVRIAHIRLDLSVNMPQRVLKGSADLALHWLDPEARQLVLDSRDLKISAVQGFDCKKWRKLGYKLVDHRLELYAVPLEDDKKR